MVKKSCIHMLEAAAETVTKSWKEKFTGNFSSRLPPLPTPRELLKLYKIGAQRTLAQNFLLDFRLTNKIVTTTGNIRDSYVCEVGPGPGNITRNIIENGARHLTVVEKDRRFFPALQLLAEACDGRMKIILGDIMDTNMEYIFPEELGQNWSHPCPPFYIIGNLPFNISTPLIIQWMRHCSKQTGPFKYGRTRLTLTFQKEVADRMVAEARTEARCRMSIMCQYLCHVEHLFTIPGRAFFPKPEVDVSVVKLTPRIKPLINQPFNIVEKVMRTVFHHRQKKCSYGIELLYPKTHQELAMETLSRTGIAPKKKSFELEMDELSALCDVYCELCNNDEDLLNFDYRAPRKRRKLKSSQEEDNKEEEVEEELGKEVEEEVEELDHRILTKT